MLLKHLSIHKPSFNKAFTHFAVDYTHKPALMVKNQLQQDTVSFLSKEAYPDSLRTLPSNYFDKKAIKASKSHPIYESTRSFTAPVPLPTENIPTTTGKLGMPLDLSDSQIYITQKFDDVSENTHLGIDVTAPLGTPIKPCDGGVVVYAGTSEEAHGANIVKLLHKKGDLVFFSVYAHMHEINVKEGEAVSSQTTLGSVGNSGLSTGPHLHFEIHKPLKNGQIQPIDPLAVLDQETVYATYDFSFKNFNAYTNSQSISY